MDYLVNYLLIFYIFGIATFSLYGLGLFVMGKTMELKKLAILAVAAAALTAPLYLIPISHGAKLCLMIFFNIFLLHRFSKFSLFACTAAVLSGFSLAVLLEYAFTLYQSSRGMVFDPSWQARALVVTPIYLAGAVLVVGGQYLLRRRPRREWFAVFNRTTDKEQLRVFRIVPLAQLYAAFMVIVVIGSTASAVPVFMSVPFSRFITIILVGPILLCFYLSSNYFNRPGAPVSPMDLVDPVTLAPIIFLVMLYTGGPASPWKVLFIPLIITNALKRHGSYGVGAILLAAAVPLYFGVTGAGLNGIWLWQLDLIYLTVYIFIFWAIRHFIAAENALSREVEGARSNLLAGISHDLRTPITLMQGYSEALLEKVEPASDSGCKYLQLILARTNGLKGLARDLLELVRLETRSIKLNLETVAVTELLEQVEHRYAADVKNKGLGLEINIPEICCGQIRLLADPGRLERVFANLIFNALNHTPPGGSITIGAAVAAEGKELTFSVADTGAGINKEELPMVFERFYKGARPRGSQKGSGLGLAISKEIVEMHGGHIRAESEEGRGSTLYFTLPLRGQVTEDAGKTRPGPTPAPRTIPLAQIVAAFIVIAALIAAGLPFATPDRAGLILMSAPGLILWAVPALWGKREQGKKHYASFGRLADLIILSPLIYHILLNSGSSSSPWKMLYIPLIITNALKPEKNCGLVAVCTAAAGLVLTAVIDQGNNLPWFVEQDLAYISLFAVIFLLVRHFMSVEILLKQELAGTRRTLLSGVARDLKAPLEVIGEKMQALIEHAVPDREKQRQYLLQIHGKVMGLRRLIENLFELVQLESRRSVLSLYPISAGEMVKRALDKHKAGLEEKGFTLQTFFRHGDLPAPSPAYPRIQADPDRLDDVFTHLLAAAAVARPRGGTITVRLTTREKEQEVLFEIYHQEQPGEALISREQDNFSETQNASHSLGMLIAEQVIRLHGGRMWAGENTGEGKGFTFSLPVAM